MQDELLMRLLKKKKELDAKKNQVLESMARRSTEATSVMDEKLSPPMNKNKIDNYIFSFGKQNSTNF